MRAHRLTLIVVSFCAARCAPPTGGPDAGADVVLARDGATGDRDALDGALDDAPTRPDVPSDSRERDVAADAPAPSDAPTTPTRCPGARDNPDVRARTSGRYTVLENVRATRLANTRRVVVYRPEGAGPFPVLYAHDGQNLFDAREAAFGTAWELDDALAEVEAQGLRVIVVAIDNNAARIDEYTPSRDAMYGGGRGDDYLDFVRNELKPLVDARFPTRCEPAQTAMMGSSLGGLISFYAGRRFPDVFGAVAALSPSFWWNDRQTVREYAADGGGDPPVLWLDAGSDEGDETDRGARSVVRDVRDVADRAIARGHRFNRDLGYLEAERAEHNELAWQRRVAHVLRFLFGPREPRALHAHVFAHENPIAVGARTSAVLQLTYEDGRRMTAPPSVAAVRSEAPAVALSMGADGVTRGVAAGEAMLSATYAGQRGALRFVVSGNPGALVERIFELRVPADTPADAPVYLAGSVAAFRSWAPDGVPLERLAPTAYRLSLLVSTAAQGEYKYTRGSWESVEVNTDHSDVGNRTVDLRSAGVEFDAVARWRDR